jgi:hypothetical protein
MPIDIEVTSDLQEMFDLPACADTSIPPPRPLKVTLPGGGTLKAFSDLSKGIPTDCAMTFSLLMQIGPFLASIECLVKVLKLIHTVVEVLKSFKTPFDLISAIPKIVKAAEPVIECALSFTPAELLPVVRDLLCLILKALKCFLAQMKSVIHILEETVPQISIAEQSGNTELAQSLQCAKENAETQAQHLTASLEALGVILDLAGDFMQVVGVQPIQLPKANGQTDLASLNQFVQTVNGVVATLQTITDVLGGCE